MSAHQPAAAIRAWLEQYNQKLKALQAEGFVMTPATTRDGLARLTASMTREIPAVPQIIDSHSAGDSGVAVRLYHPAPEKALPVLIYCHGGGHMAGSVEVYDPICRKLALASRHIVISIDYRLAPEHPYPAGLQDASAVIWQYREILRANGLRFDDRLSVGGDSGGGAMCASLVHALRHEHDIDIANQVLIYPSLDYSMRLPSVSENGQGYFLHSERMAWLFDQYFQNGEDRMAASPLYMPLDGKLPRSLVITAGFCPLRDEGMAYVERLCKVGVNVEHRHFDDMIHAFLNMEDIAHEACRQVYRVIGDFLDPGRD